VIALTQYDVNIQMITFNSATGDYVNSKKIHAIMPSQHHKSILVTSDPVNPMAYLATEYYFNNETVYKYQIVKFGLLNTSNIVESAMYRRSTNGSAENQPVLMFGETDEVLYIFARQDLRYKFENYTNGTMNNDTVIKNNTLVRLNWGGNITFGFAFGNNSGNRFMDFIYVD